MMKKQLPFLWLVLWLALSSAGRAESRPVVVEENDQYLPLLFQQKGVQLPQLKWQRGGWFSSWCQTGWYSSPAAANIDGDAQAEVLAGSYDLVALDGESGALQWRAESDNRVWPGVAVADLTQNGSLEIIVGRSGDSVSVYNTSGGLVWERHPFGMGEVRTLALGDLDKNGEIEIISGRAGAGSTRQLNVFEADGSVRPGWPARREGEAGYGWGMYNQNAATGDLDGDGDLEIIGPTDTHYITALDDRGNQLPANTMYGVGKVWSQVGVHVEHGVDLRGYANCGEEHRPNFADSAPVIADVDGDGSREMVVVGNVYNCDTNPYTSLYHMPFIFKADRTRWATGTYDWTALPTPDAFAGPLAEDYNRIETALPNPAIADLDNDGKQEILYASYDGRIHAYWLDKSEHGNWPYSVTNPAEGFLRFASEPTVADLDNNGRAEVIFASWTEKDSGQSGKLHILDDLGNPIHEITLPMPVGEGWNGALAAPTLANIDLDADLEVILLTSASGVVVYDLPGSSTARILWGTGRGGFLRNGSR